MTACVALAAFTLTQGCYAYAPLTTGASPRVGERIRLVLTREGTTEMARYLGPNVTEAEGALASVAADGALTVAVDMVQTANGIRQPWTGEGVVSFPRAYVTEMRERTFLRRQSVIAMTALGIGLVTIAVIALRAAGAGGGGEQPPPPPP